MPAQGSLVVWGREGYGITHYSHDGELATPYDDGTDVVVLGDSQTEAYQVGWDRNYVSLAEQDLQQRGRRINLHNLGRSNVGLPYYVNLAPFIRDRYRPALVVIQLSEKDLADSYTVNAERMDYFVPTGAALGLVHAPPSPRDHWLGKLMNASTLLVEGTQRLRDLQGAGSQVERADAGPAPAPAVSASAALGALERAYAGVPVIVVLLPYVPAVDNGALVRQAPEYDALVAAVKEHNSWRVVDPLPEFQHLVETWKLPRGFPNGPPGVGHLNADGHSVVGRLVSAAIQAALP